MPTSNQESILFLGGPQDGQRVNVERPLPATVRCYYPALQSSSFLTTSTEDPPLSHGHVIYRKMFFRVRGQEHIVYVVEDMSEHDAENLLLLYSLATVPSQRNTEQPVPSMLATQQAPEAGFVYPEFILQEAETSYEDNQSMPISIRAEFVSPVFGGSVNVAKLMSNMIDRRITIGGLEGVITSCNVSCPPDGFMQTSIRVRQLPNMEAYLSTGINVSFEGNNMATPNAPAQRREEPEPLGMVVPLRNPGEAPKLRRITLPK